MSRPRHWTYQGEQTRKRVLRRDNYTCQIGGPGCTVVATTVDHIHPKAWGGTEHESNLRAACWPCNQSKGARAGAVQRVPLVSPFFSSSGHSRAPLLNLSLSGRYGIVTSDYSRKPGDDRDTG